MYVGTNRPADAFCFGGVWFMRKKNDIPVWNVSERRRAPTDLLDGVPSLRSDSRINPPSRLFAVAEEHAESLEPYPAQDAKPIEHQIHCPAPRKTCTLEQESDSYAPLKFNRATDDGSRNATISRAPQPSLCQLTVSPCGTSGRIPGQYSRVQVRLPRLHNCVQVRQPKRGRVQCLPLV